MDRITIDAGLAARLKALTASVELVDGDGTVVAVARPGHAAADLVGPDLSPEEIDRRCQPGRKTYSTEEVLANLRKLA